MAKVSHSTITRAAAKVLSDAMEGELVDAAHPAALAFLQRQELAKLPSPLPGVDARYEEALAHCQEVGRWTASAVQRGLKIGYGRASKIFAMMQATGVVPKKEEEEVHEVPESAPAEPKVQETPKKPYVRGYAAKKLKEQAQEPDKPPVPVPEFIQPFAHKSLTELVDTFGTDTRFETWLNSLQKIAGVQEKRLKNAKTEGELVGRNLVTVGIFDHIDAAFTRMLTDGRQTIAARAHTITKAGGTIPDVDKMVGDQLSSLIKPAKDRMIKALKNL